MTSEDVWEVVRQSEKLKTNSPEWLNSFLSMPYPQAANLPSSPEPEDITTEGIFCPRIEYKSVTLDYLTFLEYQIKMKPRGEEWGNILKCRLKALVPYKGKKLFFVYMIQRTANLVNGCSIYFDPTRASIIHYEVY